MYTEIKKNAYYLFKHYIMTYKKNQLIGNYFFLQYYSPQNYFHFKKYMTSIKNIIYEQNSLLNDKIH